MQVTAVCSVGLAEGSSHVNWRKVRYTVVWWAAGFAIVMVSTAALVAQGTRLFTMLLPQYVVCTPMCSQFDQCQH